MKIIRPLAITDSILLSSNVAETDYPAWSVATTYNLGDYVIVVATHQVYQSVVASNTGNAVTDTTKWLNIGFTNRWKMFDKVVGTVTSNANTITTSTKSNSIVDSIAFLNMDAASLRIKVTDTVDGVVYDTTTSLVSLSGINDFYPWFFEPIVRMNDTVFFDLPPYSNVTIDITATDTGGTPKIGTCVMGQQRYIGDSQWGSTVGNIDYSLKTVDAFGNYTVTQRPFSKRGNFNLYLDTTTVTEMQKLFASYRSTPIVWSGTNETDPEGLQGAMLIYGFYKDFEINVAYSTVSTCTLTIEGLT